MVSLILIAQRARSTKRGAYAHSNHIGMKFPYFGPSLIFALSFACATPSESAVEHDVRVRAAILPAAANERAGETRAPDEELTALLEKPLDAERAARVAVLANPVLASRLAQLGLARAEILENATPNPSVEAEARFGHHGADPALEFSFQQPLTELFYSAGHRTAASAELEAEKWEAAGAILALVLEVKAAFFAHQANVEKVALHQRVMQAEDARLAAAEALYQAGNISELDYLGEKDQRERMTTSLLEAQEALHASKEALQVLLAVDGWKMGTLPVLPKIPAEYSSLEETVAGANFGLRAAEEKVRAANKRLSLSKWAGVLPDIGVGVTAHRDEPGESWEFGPSLEVELPLFDRASGSTAREEAMLRILAGEQKAKSQAIRSAARKTAGELRTAHARAAHQREVVLPLRARIVEQTRAGVNAMTISVFQLLSAEREQVEAMLEEVEAREKYFLVEAELAHLVAGGGAEE